MGAKGYFSGITIKQQVLAQLQSLTSIESVIIKFILLMLMSTGKDSSLMMISKFKLYDVQIGCDLLLWW
jgi:hypothetical protein